eukprot:TRINITY_DN50391_c0_g1_i1.p1 TRINITY_DN50391_c0_g1~~TRINITY_DN50391_c0_g1_i1.p1  ORF type:complete len:487 (-),score=62.27 TRINITY_DN50391_c0_g1_i1:77-1537(-)
MRKPERGNESPPECALNAFVLSLAYLGWSEECCDSGIMLYEDLAKDINRAVHSSTRPGSTALRQAVLCDIGIFSNGVCLLRLSEALWMTIGQLPTDHLQSMFLDPTREEDIVIRVRDILWSITFTDASEAIGPISREDASLRIVVDLLRAFCCHTSRRELEDAESADVCGDVPRGRVAGCESGNLRQRMIRQDRDLLRTIDTFFCLLLLVVQPRSYLTPARQLLSTQSDLMRYLVHDGCSLSPAKLLSWMLPAVWDLLTCDESYTITCTEAADMWRLLVTRPIFSLIVRELLIDEFPEVAATLTKLGLLEVSYAALLVAAPKTAEIACRFWTALDENCEGNLTRQVFLQCFVDAVSEEVLWPVTCIAGSLGRALLEPVDIGKPVVTPQTSATSSLVVNAASCGAVVNATELLLGIATPRRDKTEESNEHSGATRSKPERLAADAIVKDEAASNSDVTAADNPRIVFTNNGKRNKTKSWHANWLPWF